jgi:hypothetical protein
MDGLSALSIAASVAQFIQFGCSLVSKSHEIYKSAHGTTIQQVDSDTATKRLVELCAALKASLCIEQRALPQGRISKQAEALENICNDCIAVSNELLSQFDKLKFGDGQKNLRYKSFRAALKSVWSEGAIDEIAKRLETHKKQLDSHILVSLRYDCALLIMRWHY